MNARRSQDCAKGGTVSTQWALSNADALLVTSRVRQLRNAKVRVNRSSLAADVESKKKKKTALGIAKTNDKKHASLSYYGSAGVAYSIWLGSIYSSLKDLTCKREVNILHLVDLNSYEVVRVRVI